MSLNFYETLRLQLGLQYYAGVSCNDYIYCMRESESPAFHWSLARSQLERGVGKRELWEIGVSFQVIMCYRIDTQLNTI